MTLASCSTTTTVFPAVAESSEDADEPFGVAGMQADAGFIEHEERIDQAGAEAGGEVDAFGFAARKRARGAVEGEITETDLVQVAEAGLHLAEDETEGVVRGGVCGQRRGIR